MERKQQEQHENIVTGLIGAFLGSLIGVACIVAIGQLGYVASASGLVMGVCTIKGYTLLGGKISRKGVIISAILIIAMTYLGHQLDYAVSLARMFDVDIFTTFQAIGNMLAEEYIDKVVYWSNLATLYLFTLLGAASSLWTAFRQSRSGGAASENTTEPTQSSEDK